MSTPIEFVDTKELVKELKSRFDELVFVGYSNKGSRHNNYHLAFKTSMHGAYGLIEVLKQAADSHTLGGE